MIHSPCQSPTIVPRHPFRGAGGQFLSMTLQLDQVVLDSLDLRPGEVVADLGAGSGYFTFRISPKVGETGKVLAVEIQEAMLNTLRARAARMKATNVEVVQGSEIDPHLPVSGVTLCLWWTFITSWLFHLR
jgi:precorrin-6B methylase 2